MWLIHFVVQQKVTPHYKLTSKIFYEKLKGKALEHDTKSDNLALMNIFLKRILKKACFPCQDLSL